jgi:NAD dependent epimerase/dehydratase family enzyme
MFWLRSTGFVGKHLTDLLIQNGYSVSILSRTKKNNTDSVFYYTWDVKQVIEKSQFLTLTISFISGWEYTGSGGHKERKEAIITSREQSAQLLYGCKKNMVKNQKHSYLHQEWDLRCHQWSGDLWGKSLRMTF